jgi:hypothetical protein
MDDKYCHQNLEINPLENLRLFWYQKKQKFPLNPTAIEATFLFPQTT